MILMREPTLNSRVSTAKLGSVGLWALLLTVPLLILLKVAQVAGETDSFNAQIVSQAVIRRLDDVSFWIVAGVAGFAAISFPLWSAPDLRLERRDIFVMVVPAVLSSIIYVVAVRITKEAFFFDRTSPQLVMVLQSVEGLVMLTTIAAGQIIFAVNLPVIRRLVATSDKRGADLISIRLLVASGLVFFMALIPSVAPWLWRPTSRGEIGVITTRSLVTTFLLWPLLSYYVYWSIRHLIFPKGDRPRESNS